MAHARLSPSGSDRWMLCPGSVAMEDGLPDAPNDNSDSGTATHFLAEQALTTGTHPATWIGRTILVGTAQDFDGAIWGADTEPSPFDIRYTAIVDGERVVRANAYVQAVKHHAEGAVYVAYERSVDIAAITGEEGASGTADAVIVTADRELQVHDLKDGYGAVAAEGNRQLMLYALGLLDELSAFCDIARVRLFIHQPRLSHSALEWAVSLEDLEAFRAEVQTAAKTALIALDFKSNWIRGPEYDYLNPGETQCQWCKAAKNSSCPAQDKFVQETVGADFDEINTDQPIQLPLGFNAEDLGKKMDAVGLVEDWCKAVRGKVESELFAGNPVPSPNGGYKLVQGKKGNRAWGDETEAEAMLKTMRLKVEEMYDMTVISPTSVEKIFGAKGSAPSVKRWNKLQALITQKEGQPSVAPESDKRPALVINAAADFDDATGGDLA